LFSCQGARDCWLSRVVRAVPVALCRLEPVYLGLTCIYLFKTNGTTPTGTSVLQPGQQSLTATPELRHQLVGMVFNHGQSGVCLPARFQCLQYTIWYARFTFRFRCLPYLKNWLKFHDQNVISIHLLLNRIQRIVLKLFIFSLSYIVLIHDYLLSPSIAVVSQLWALNENEWKHEWKWDTSGGYMSSDGYM
jgi:hypothetical protein